MVAETQALGKRGQSNFREETAGKREDGKIALTPLPLGAEVLAGGGVRFRLWAPAARKVEVRIESRFVEMQPQADGWFEIVGVAGQRQDITT